MGRGRKAAKDEAELVRFGVSIPRELIEKFDELQAERGLLNRSESIRELIRGNLAQEDWKAGDGQQAATLMLLLDVQKPEAQKRVMECQREIGAAVVSSLHARLSPREEVWVLVLRGTGAELRNYTNTLLSVKGVVLAKLLATGKLSG
jgi:CopG family transcriptional regulator, nickel-responsive regulator